MDRRADVKDTYDRIASHFATTREYAWPEVEAFLENHPIGAVGLDLGCGNCRHAELLAAEATTTIGIDVSRGALETGHARALERGFDVSLLQADATHLPLAANTVDSVVYVATLHHLPSESARRDSLDELARVLAPGKYGLVSVWSTAHDTFDDVDEGFDTTIDWTLPDGEIVDRYYHIYTPAEFVATLEASTLELREWTVSSGNCYATVVGRSEGT